MPPRRLVLPWLAALLAGCTEHTPSPRASAEAVRPASPAPAGPEKASPGSAPELVEQGLKSLGSGDVAAGSRFFEQALRVDPTNRQALWRLAQTTQARAIDLPRPQSSPLFLRSADLLRRLRAAHPRLTPDERNALPVVFYNEACTLALDGETARAVNSLAEAVDAGFQSVEHIEADDELDSLRDRPDFQGVMRRLEQRHALALLAGSKPFPFDFRLKDLDSKPVALADFQGKVTVVNFWGSWCPPCRKEVPHLVELARRYRDRGLAVVAVGYEIDQSEEASKALRSFVKEHGITYPCLTGDEATLRQISRFEGFPTTLLLDRSGKVRLTLAGYQPLSALEAAAALLLAEGGQKAASK